MKIRLNEVSTSLDDSVRSRISKLARVYRCFTVGWDANATRGCQMLIKHGAINGFVWDKTYWLIRVSGSGKKSDKRPEQLMSVGTISWHTLIANLESFLQRVSSEGSISLEDIDVLYGHDQQKEEMLKAFETSNPYLPDR